MQILPAGNRHMLWARIGALTTLTVVVFVLAACAIPLTPAADRGGAAESPATDSGSSAEADQAQAEDADSSTNSAQEAFVDPDQEEYNGVPVGFTEDGYPYRGHLDAPVVMYEFSDYQCPFCMRYFVETEPALNEAYVRDGTLRVVFRDFPLEQLHPNAPGAHEATLCVAEQGAALYWEMHNQVFKTQQEWAQDPESLTFFAGLAEEIGVDLEQYSRCMESGAKQADVQAGVEEASQKGFNGTPSFQFVNADSGESYNLIGAQPYGSFAEWIESIAVGETPPSDGATADSGENAEIPFWATKEGLAPDPERPGFTLAGDFYQGNPEASVVIVEYSDFQCPYCKQHAETTQPALDEQFVDTDEVMWVFKHFPLSIHPQAPQAGAAAECLAEQNLFWEAKGLIFDSVNKWGVRDPIPELIDVVANSNLDVDMDAFEACINDEAALAAVDSDLADGSPFVRGTPTFIVLYNGEGRIIPGALPVERFTEVLQQVVDENTGGN